ncbi:ABC transporter B family member 11-like protein isoform X1 [Tanacetum coccineum]
MAAQEIDYTNVSRTTLANVNGDIKFSHVGFNYPSRPDIKIFRDLCLNIRSGQTIAIVGESGSRKSTVVSPLQRFYDVDSGQITLDGVDIQKLRVKCALDAESEKVVQDALDQVMLHRMTIVVAHRLSTIRGANVIAVVKNGVIAEKGKHEKLINIKDGICVSLVTLHTSSSAS